VKSRISSMKNLTLRKKSNSSKSKMIWWLNSMLMLLKLRKKLRFRSLLQNLMFIRERLTLIMPK
jgi:hypothetical protein